MFLTMVLQKAKSKQLGTSYVEKKIFFVGIIEQITTYKNSLNKRLFFFFPKSFPPASFLCLKFVDRIIAGIVVVVSIHALTWRATVKIIYSVVELSFLYSCNDIRVCIEFFLQAHHEFIVFTFPLCDMEYSCFLGKFHTFCPLNDVMEFGAGHVAIQIQRPVLFLDSEAVL